MIFKRWPEIHIHPILIVFIIIAFLTGTFVELFIILMIVFIHEMGHYLMATHFKWRIKSITLWLFGGVMETEEHGTKPVFEEMLVTIAGPFQHLLIYLFFISFINFNDFFTPYVEMIFYYNTLILLFNLLPIWPLDGGKITYLFLTMFLPYRKAYYSTIIFSFLICALLLLLQLFVFPFTLSTFFIIVFILFENRTEWKNRYYVFIRFLLSRYDGNHYVRKQQPLVVAASDSLMDVFALFKRENNHPIYIMYANQSKKKVAEKDCLRKYFFDHEYQLTIGQVFNKHS